MDLDKFDTRKSASSGAKMALVNPIDGEPFMDGKEPITITLLGADSPEVQGMSHKLANTRINKVSRAGGKLNKVITSEELESERIEMLVLATKGWNGISMGGAPLEFTAENARRVYTDFPWIREQADTFISDRGNFLGN